MAVPEKIKIVEANVDDIPIIRQIAEIAFPETYKNIIPEGQIPYMMEWMYSHESLNKQITEENNTFFLANILGENVGYVSIRPDGEDVYHLEKLYVLPDYQHNRVGQKLFNHALNFARQKNGKPCKVQLNVNRNNPAFGFYKHQGMTVANIGDFDIGNGFFMNDYIMEITV